MTAAFKRERPASAAKEETRPTRRPGSHAPMKSNRSRVSRRVLIALLAVAAGLLPAVYAATADRQLLGKIELNRTGRVMLFAVLVWVELTVLSLLWLTWVVVAWVAGRSGRSH